MKSFSSSSFATDQSEILALALAAVQEHPQALFTDFQWFLYEARDTVFFTAFSKPTLRQGPDRQSGRRDGGAGAAADATASSAPARASLSPSTCSMPSPRSNMSTSSTAIPTNGWASPQDIFARNDLPLFRVQAAVRKGGPDAEGRASVLQVRSSHALLEGSDFGAADALAIGRARRHVGQGQQGRLLEPHPLGVPAAGR